MRDISLALATIHADSDLHRKMFGGLKNPEVEKWKAAYFRLHEHMLRPLDLTHNTIERLAEFHEFELSYLRPAVMDADQWGDVCEAYDGYRATHRTKIQGGDL